MHPEIPEKRVEHMFEEMDVGHKGEVDYSNFIAATVSCSKNFGEGSSILGAFHMLDSDHDGFITEADLKNAFDGCLSPASCTAIVSHSDTEGRISFADFKASILELMHTSPDTHHEVNTFVSQVMEATPLRSKSKSRSKSGRNLFLPEPPPETAPVDAPAVAVKVS